MPSRMRPLMVPTGASTTVTRRPLPGAYELPLAAKYCAESGRYAGVAALGFAIVVPIVVLGRRVRTISRKVAAMRNIS